jgi:hypothetical protein
MTAVGGAMGGYYWRGKRESELKRLGSGSVTDVKVIDSQSSKRSLPLKKR